MLSLPSQLLLFYDLNRKKLKCCCFVPLFYSQLSGMSYKYFKYGAQAFFISITLHFFISFSFLFFSFCFVSFLSTVIVQWFNGIPLCQYGKCVFIAHCSVNFIIIDLVDETKVLIIWAINILSRYGYAQIVIYANKQKKWRKSSKHCAKKRLTGTCIHRRVIEHGNGDGN